MSHEITFNCSRCRKAITIRPDVTRPHVPCLHCGAMNHIPVKKMKSHHFGMVAIAVVLLPIALLGVCWSLTMTLGADSLRPEISQLVRGQRNVAITIKTPAPFVLTYTLNVPSSGEGKASLTIRKYYYWFIVTRREVPESEVPDLFKRVWR